MDAFHTFLSGLQDPMTTYQRQPLVQWEEGMPDMLFKIQDFDYSSDASKQLAPEVNKSIALNDRYKVEGFLTAWSLCWSAGAQLTR